MKNTRIFLYVVIVLIVSLCFLDSVSSNIVFNKKLKDVPELEKKVSDLNESNRKLTKEKNDANKEIERLNSELGFIRSLKTIKVPEYYYYGNQELLDEVDELESEKSDLESENEDLKSRLEDEGLDY